MNVKMMGLFLAVLGLSGCGILYTNIRMPRAYRSATASEVKSEAGDKTVSGKSCNRSLFFLFAWGDASYAAAARNALQNDPDGLLYDVKSDMQAFSVLSLYTKTCTIMTGKVGKVK